MTRVGVRTQERPREPAEGAAGLPSVAEERLKWCATPRWQAWRSVGREPAVILAPPALSSVILYGVDILCVVGFV